MNSRLHLSAAAGLLAAATTAAWPVPATAQAGPQRTASALASVTLSEPLTVAPGYPLAFGLIKGGSTVGLVVVRPEGLRSPEGGAQTVGSGPCQFEYCEDENSPSNVVSASYWGPGMFDVSGAPDSAFRVSSPSSVAAYLRVPAVGRLPQLYVRDFRFWCRSTGQATGALDSAGKDHCRVGGTIDIPAGMKAASYRVDVPISVEYF